MEGTIKADTVSRNNEAWSDIDSMTDSEDAKSWAIMPATSGRQKNFTQAMKWPKMTTNSEMMMHLRCPSNRNTRRRLIL
jgi:hypothetical protein